MSDITPMLYSDSGPTTDWTRRAWLTRTVATPLMMVPVLRFPLRRTVRPGAASASMDTGSAARAVTPPTSNTLDDWEALAQRAVDAAMHAGAQYADARLTRTVVQFLGLDPYRVHDKETVGLGVRTLVNGYWGFTGCPSGDTPRVEQLAREAVAQAAVNARGAAPRTVELGKIPAAVGHWATPVKIDPFAISFEEKFDYMHYWERCALKVGLLLHAPACQMVFVKQERVVVTSEGGRFSQTIIESGGMMLVGVNTGHNRNTDELYEGVPVQGIDAAGCGWERFLEAKIPEQLQTMEPLIHAIYDVRRNVRPGRVGRYTLVCDGATIADLLSKTVGPATQLDRALGYEANAGGTSFLDDPLNMLGTFKVGSPLVNVTANRSAPGQLATVKWDEEGVAPQDMTLVKDGVLTDFQTTREQAAWLAPYYAKIGRPAGSNGCAGAESALAITMQHMPNLALEANTASVGLDDLIANVKDGILIERCKVVQADSQARNGLLINDGNGRQVQYDVNRQMRIIKDGKLGAMIDGVGLQFNTLDLWRNIVAVGGRQTQAVLPISYHVDGARFAEWFEQPPGKGQPKQVTSFSVQAPAVTIKNQAMIIPWAKA